MPLRKLWITLHTEAGSAALEFITVGMLLLIPLVYLVLTLSVIQSASFATEGAARQAARIFTNSATLSEAQSQAQTAVQVTLADYGVATANTNLSISCQQPTNCLTPGKTVSVTVATSVPLPGIPEILGLDSLARVSVSGISTMTVSRFHS